jgi:hypothetical protein
MSDNSLSDTLRSLAAKFDSVQEILGGPGNFVQPPWPYAPVNTTVPVPVPRDTALLQKLDILTQQVDELRKTVNLLRTQAPPASILPLNPMYGIEVIPKREVVIPESTTSLSMADRLLLNRDAKKALEAEEMGAYREDEYPLGEEDEADMSVTKPAAREVYSTKALHSMEVEGAEEEAEEEAEEAEEAEAEEAEEEAEEEADLEGGPEEDEAEEEAEELTEFEYKGNTFYRDSENNVFMLGEDGELDAENPVGTWNAEKGKIVVKK